MNSWAKNCFIFNIVGLIVASILFGMATSCMEKAGEPFKSFFKSASEIIIHIMRWLIW